MNAAEIDALLDTPEQGIHLLGVCGVGMAGLAILLQGRGHAVSGCDAAHGARAAWLSAKGVPVSVGHSPDHLTADTQILVRSSAVRPEDPELCAAAAAGVPVLRRGEVLAGLLHGRRSVAVTGTHGKTTTTAFIVQLLERCKVPSDWFIGWEVPGLDGVASASGAELCVVEGDESDGTIAVYEPSIAVLTNVEDEHMETFGDAAALDACYRQFLSNAGEDVVVCADDPRAMRLARDMPRVTSYGFDAAADVRGENLSHIPSGFAFDVVCRGTSLGRWSLPAQGRHNVQNVLAAIAVGMALGIDAEALRGACASLALPYRRMELVHDHSGVHVYEDYACHHTEVAAVLHTLRPQVHGRLILIFQPHRYTRLRDTIDELPEALGLADHAVITPVYAASERPVDGARATDLYRACRGAGLDQMVLAESLDQAWDYVAGLANAGDAIVLMGPGDVTRLAGRARERAKSHVPYGSVPHAEDLLQLGLSDSRVRPHADLGARSTLGVGGQADLYADVQSIEDLCKLLVWTERAEVPLRVLGVGSNVLVSDLGVRGLVLRLGGEVFRGIHVDGTRVRVGAGCANRALLAHTIPLGLGGLEFLEGIPGSIGGAVRMNAGAFGGEIGRFVRGLECVDAKGRPRCYSHHELSFVYRSCPEVIGKVVTWVELDFEYVDREVAEARRAEIAEKRAWWQGLRSAGSVFKNPEGDFAGALVERAGLRGERVGGARIFETHGNVLVAERGATASDVIALIEHVQTQVRIQFGVELEREILYLS